ncbi:MAG TPA: hypothetical protein VK590_08630 [Saprospiraceae bacterium]|nr:hypothetical protein [Saprospiraceae bacterium]
MKTDLFKRIQFILLFLISINCTLFSQDEYKWDSHGIGFKAASDMKVTVNKADEFEATNEKITLDIFPWQDENVNKDDLADGIISIAKELKFDNVHDADAMEIDDFQGYYVLGTKDGVEALIMILLDKESSTNMIVTIVYEKGNQDAAIKIADSFYAYDK